MRYSDFFIVTSRQDPKQAECISHRLMLKASLIYMVSAGIYVYLPFGLIMLRKIEDIIRKNMNRAGANELLMTALQPIDIWEKTGRDKSLQEVMFRFEDRRGRKLCLGPTHEEEITEIARRYIVSYRQLPVILYQIQTKYRDEPRPRFGLVRSCEFIMKDAYSFDADQEGLDKSYQKMFEAYKNIFSECGLNFVISEADAGAMGGNYSHEFLVPAEIGEDILWKCDSCGLYQKEENLCPQCKKQMQEEKMIEVGHVFKLGTKYSLAQEALFLNQQGKQAPLIMGCYGIGVSRLLPAIIEQNNDRKGIIWPKQVSYFQVNILLLDADNEQLRSQANSLYCQLEDNGFKVLFDDRQEKPGVKFNDAYLLGIPFIIIIGKKFLETNQYELEIRASGEKKIFNQEELFNFLKEEYAA